LPASHRPAETACIVFNLSRLFCALTWHESFECKEEGMERMFRIPKPPKLPIKRIVGLGSMAVLLTTGIAGAYNFAAARVDEHKHASVMKAAQTCEDKLHWSNTPCTLDEQRALLAREDIERREWKGGAAAGIGIMLLMASF
jgi:hypothetical protein